MVNIKIAVLGFLWRSIHHEDTKITKKNNLSTRAERRKSEKSKAFVCFILSLKIGSKVEGNDAIL